MVLLNEQQRIAEYRDGWNDAQRDRNAQAGRSIMYQIGYIEASKGSPQRFFDHDEQTAAQPHEVH